MKLGIYLNPNGIGPLVLVSFIMIPTLIAEKLYGPLKLRGTIETDDHAKGFTWPLLLGQMDDTDYTTVQRLGAGDLILAAMAKA